MKEKTLSAKIDYDKFVGWFVLKMSMKQSCCATYLQATWGLQRCYF